MLQEIIVLVVVYIAFIGWANAPKPATVTAPITESTTQPATPKPQPMPKPIIEPMSKPAYVATAPKPKAIAYQPLETMPIRLYQLEAALQTLIEALPEAGDRRTQNGIELLRLVAECLLTEGDKLEALAGGLPE